VNFPHTNTVYERSKYTSKHKQGWGNYNRIEGRLMMGGKVKVKVDFTLEQATKTQIGIGGIALLFL
jgi:hypothetical protein